MYYVNENIQNLVRSFDQNGRKDFLRLDLNENPGGLGQDFIDQVLETVDSGLLAQYPETEQFSVTLAQHLGTDLAHICLVNGSAEGIRYIIQAFTSEHGRIVGVVPSYFMFQVYAKMYGREFVPVPYQRNLTMDVKDILAALHAETELLVLLNPNNPMGNVYSEEEFQDILEACRKNEITVLIDEAYHYFYPNSFLQYALQERHILITRTFSKMFSLAGCRLGYVVGHPMEIQTVQKLCTPHNINALAMKFAGAVIKTPGMIEELIRKFKQGRHTLVERLEEHGYRYQGEAGNFLFIAPKNVQADQVVKRMKNEKKILIKSYPNVGDFGTCLRVTIGEKDYMEQFMDAFLEIDR